MADSTALAGLLDRAGKVFSLAGKLGRAFHEEHQGQSGQIDTAGWSLHASDFDEYCAGILDLRDAMQNPPDGFAAVAPPLLVAARIAKGIRDAMRRPDGQTMAAYLDFFPDLNTLCENGWQAIRELSTPRQPDDPFAFVDETPVFSLLERFPVTTAGHVAFLEFVRDEVHYAAEAKRAQFERGHPNETLESMVRGIKWDEAGQRVSKLSELPADVVAMVASVLQRELSVGTVEQIDELLTPPLRMLRSMLESASLLEDATVVEPPELIELKRWGAFDGIKGHWEHMIAAAGYWGLEVDARHRNIAFLLQQVIGGDPPESAIRDYLFQVHSILPSDPINLVKLEQVLKQDAEQNRTGNSKVSNVEVPELIGQLIDGPDDAELSEKALALLEAYLKQPVSLSQMQRETQVEGQSETARRRNKLKLIRDFNRNLQSEHSGGPQSRKRRGRKKADYETVQREAELAGEWKRARDSGVYKADFAKDKGMTLKDLDRLLDRVKARERASE